jgi:transposase
MWVAPEIKDPVALLAPTRKNIGVFGAVSATDGKLVTRKEEGRFNALTFLDYLQLLIQHRRPGRKIILIVDNARWHHAKLLRPWLEENRHLIELFFLPAYSPDFNVIERVWKLTRRLCTHNRFFATLDELADSVFTQFEEWEKENPTLARLCAIN